MVHQTKRVREMLERGESLEWTSRGRLIAVLQSPNRSDERPDRVDWIERAKSVGAVARPGTTVAGLVDEGRGT